MTEIWGPWIELELINGWEPIPHFDAPAFQMRMTLEETEVRLRGAAAGGRRGSPIAILPSDIGAFRIHKITEMDINDRVLRTQVISADETGFLFVKEFAHDAQREI